VQALKERRSRRVCHGMTLPDGPLAYTSPTPPVPLTETEEALLAFAACGITGCALSDLPFGPNSGGNIMAGLLGRTIASGDAIQTVSLVVVNDSGAYFYRRPQDFDAKIIHELTQLSAADKFEEQARRMRVKVCDQRPEIPREPAFNINVNR